MKTTAHRVLLKEYSNDNVKQCKSVMTMYAEEISNNDYIARCRVHGVVNRRLSVWCKYIIPRCFLYSNVYITVL